MPEVVYKVISREAVEDELVRRYFNPEEVRFAREQPDPAAYLVSRAKQGCSGYGAAYRTDNGYGYDTRAGCVDVILHSSNGTPAGGEKFSIRLETLVKRVLQDGVQGRLF